MLSSRCWRFAFGALSALSLAMPAAAQQAADSERDYAAVVADATREFDAGHFEEARALFVRAHELKPSARTLRGLGFAEFELRHYAIADRTLRASLADGRNPLTAAQRKEVEQLLERIREFVGRYRVAFDPPSLGLTIDGGPATLETDGTLLLDAGAHTLVASAPGRASETRQIDVVGGEEKTLQITLAPQPGAVASSGVPGAALAPASGAPRPSLLPWLLVGGGAAVAVTGIVLFAIGRSDASKVENPKDGASYASIRGAQDSAPVLSNTGIALTALGLVGAGVGVVLLMHRPSAETAVGSAALRLGPGGVHLTGAF